MYVTHGGLRKSPDEKQKSPDEEQKSLDEEHKSPDEEWEGPDEEQKNLDEERRSLNEEWPELEVNVDDTQQGFRNESEEMKSEAKIDERQWSSLSIAYCSRKP